MSRRARRKAPESEGGHERWLVSYADLITLLFALFVILYAMSQADLDKLKKVSEGMKAAFGGGKAPSPTKSSEEDSESGDDSPADSKGGGTGPIQKPLHSEEASDSRRSAATSVDSVALEKIRNEIEQAESLELRVEKRGLVIRFTLNEMFDPGSSSIHPDLVPLLDRIGKVLARSRRRVWVEGYAEKSELRRANPASSEWELSSARSAWVIQHWLSAQVGFLPDKLGIGAYGSARPYRSSAESGEETVGIGAFTNRRIEITVLRE